MKRVRLKTKTLKLILAIVPLMAFSSCSRRCHCTGYDGSHTYYTEQQLKELDKTCSGMEYYMEGLLYSICEYDLTDY